jgi:type I restriction enzyme, S subunit
VRARREGAMKDVGSAWVGPIPAAWSIVRLKHISKIFSGGTPDKEQKQYWDGGTIPWLSSGEVNQWFITAPSTFITEDGYRYSSAKWIPKHSLVMALAGQGRTKGMIAQLGIDATCNQSMAAIVLARSVHPRFVQWWLHTNYETIRNLAGGEQREGLNLEIVGDIPCPLPTARTQGAIADYLDRQTGAIDALIAAKQRQLDLIAEKRKAMIASAVTRGLDPAAPMRDSGVPWLGELPAHWEVKRMKYLFRLIAEPAPEDNSYELLSLYTDLGVKPRRELEERGNKASTTDNYWMVRRGDLVVNKLLAWMGAFGVSEFDGVTSPAYDILRAVPDVEPFYYHHLFRCGICQPEVKRRSYGIMDMRLRLYFDRLGDMTVPVPSKQEQAAIIAHLVRETAKLDNVRHATERTMELLKERRAALIAAAVTGQIKVV